MLYVITKKVKFFVFPYKNLVLPYIIFYFRVSKQEIHKFRLTFLRGAAFAAGIAKKVPAVQAAPAAIPAAKAAPLKKVGFMRFIVDLY